MRDWIARRGRFWLAPAVGCTGIALLAVTEITDPGPEALVALLGVALGLVASLLQWRLSAGVAAQERALLAESEAARERLALLVSAGEVLADALNYVRTLADVCTLVVPELGDWVAVDVLDADGRLQRAAVAHTDPDKAPLARELGRRYPPDPRTHSPLAQALRTGRPVLLAEVHEATIAAATQDADHAALLRALGCRSAIVAPLVSRGRALGTLTLVLGDGPRRFTPEDADFAGELARRLAVAVDHAHLYFEAAAALERAGAPAMPLWPAGAPLSAVD